MAKATKSGRTGRYAVPAVDGMLDIVEFLAGQSRPWGINELARELGITTNMAFRILRRLTERGYVEAAGDSGGCQLGARFFSLGMRLYTRFELRTCARPHLERLAAATGETCQLHVLNDRGMLVVDVVNPRADFFLQVVPGAHLNCHANAFGKAVLAFLPPAEARGYLGGKLDRLTDRTLTSAAAVVRQFESIRKTGVAFDREEYVRGVHCVGAPVFGASGAVVAGLGTTGLAMAREGAGAKACERAVLDCAAAVSKDIGYTGDRFEAWRKRS
jgi:DNA-binding IclR family transcriptional regulator